MRESSSSPVVKDENAPKPATALEQIGQQLRGWLDGEDNARLEEAFGRRKEKHGSSDIIPHNRYKELTPYNYDRQKEVNVDSAIKDIVKSASEVVTKDFPILDDYLHAIGFDDEPWPAGTYLSITPDGRVGQIIALSQKMWHNEQAIKDFMRTDGGRESHINTMDPRSIITHEYGTSSLCASLCIHRTAE